MGLAAFNQARRLAAEAAQAAKASAPVEVQTEVHASPEPEVLPRRAELEVLSWRELKSLLEDYGLPSSKPQDQSWEGYAIPLILEYEGL